MLRCLYARIISLSASRGAPWWLAAVSFAESSVFPVPPDALLIPMVLARPDRAWRLATVCTIASVAGGALGYLIGYAVFDQLARPMISFYGFAKQFSAFQDLYAKWGLWVILIKGMTPIPYKIVTIASGAAHFNFAVFMAASVATRSARFFLAAGLLKAFGPPVRDFIERRLTLLTSVAVAGVAGGFLVLRFL